MSPCACTAVPGHCVTSSVPTVRGSPASCRVAPILLFAHRCRLLGVERVSLKPKRTNKRKDSHFCLRNAALVRDSSRCKGPVLPGASLSAPTPVLCPHIPQTPKLQAEGLIRYPEAAEEGFPWVAFQQDFPLPGNAFLGGGGGGVGGWWWIESVGIYELRVSLHLLLM